MELKDKRFLVVGLGESGLAMARWLAGEGARVRVADSRADPPGRAALAAALPDVPLSTGAFQDSTFAHLDAIALSPGVPCNTPAIVAAGVPVISEVDLFAAALARYQPEARVLAITGSNGKTTTTALTAHLLNAAGIEAVACGNISPSLLDAFMAARAAGRLPAVWVLELSSFQLETTHILRADAAALLNISEDHLDRHADLATYAAVKARIFQGGALRILNRDDDRSLALGGCGTRMLTFGLGKPPRPGHYGLADGALWCGATRLIAVDALPLRGLHNAANLMAALALAAAIGIEADRLLPGLTSFRGLPHRVEPVAEIGGVLYVDDSKGTNVGATLAAIAGMGRPVAIILGGDGKGQDFAPLAKALARHGRAVALIGRDAPVIEAAIAGCGLPLRRCAGMAEAVTWLAGEARAGDCLLLSPACASLDQYRNYAERAADFIAAVRRLEAGA